jgi:prophage regulatory protein
MSKRKTQTVRRTIKRQQLREIVPLADSTIYEMEQRGEFPPRLFALTPRCVVWDLSEIEAWLTARRARPIKRARAPDVSQRKNRPVKERGQAPESSSPEA